MAEEKKPFRIFPKATSINKVPLFVSQKPLTIKERQAKKVIASFER
ncbi:hypothetical protein ACT29H_08805 [Thermophagus sp. OGC60D27]